MDEVIIESPNDFLKYTKYWLTERDRLEKEINDVGWKHAGEETIRRYRIMEKFAGEVSNVLAIFADVFQAAPRYFKWVN